MEKEVIIKRIKELLLEITNSAFFVIILFNAYIILEFHKIVPFFPILFLFDLLIIIGYPLFLRYVLKKKWFECCKDKMLQIKYIFFPMLLLEILALFVVILCYPNETLQAT